MGGSELAATTGDAPAVTAVAMIVDDIASSSLCARRGRRGGRRGKRWRGRGRWGSSYAGDYGRLWIA